MGDIISLGLWIKRRRKALDLTQSELARRVSCSLGLIHKIEADARRPSREIAARLADQLELAGDEHAAFIQVARMELGAARLAAPTQSIARSAFVPAPGMASGRDTADEQPAAPRTNLPIPPTALIGRLHEIEQVAGLLRRADRRLVTLTGPGGIGKTRLSIQVAANLVEAFADGVYLVDLAPIRDPQLVSAVIAVTLGIRERVGQPLLATLKDDLRDRQLLLLLDNFEHLIDAAPLVAELLSSAAQLKVLVTSREVLKLRGEMEIAVPPLRLPDPAQLPPLDQLPQYAAVALFIERARDIKPDFAVTSANAPAVAEICIRLDGLPLAIELAAARLKLFPPEALLARLSRRLALLSGGLRDLPARQQTIRNTIAWSYELLKSDKQTLFRRLGVFVGGWTLEAAGAVTTLNVEPERWNVLDGLAALLDKSLVRRTGEADETRFTMLETIREYALEQLEASGEGEFLRRQHASYYLGLGETASANADSDDPAWMARYNREYDNLCSALAWSQTTAGDSEIALQLTYVLGTLWYHRGVRHEAIAALKRALDHPLGVGRTVAHFHAHEELAQFFALTGNYAAAQLQFEAARLLAQELGDSRQYASTLERLGWLAREQGDSATAWARVSESLAIVRELGDTACIAGTLNTLAGVAILKEDPESAEALLLESRAVGQQATQDNFCMAWTLNHLGHVAQLRGAYDRAIQLHHESLSLFGSDGDRSGAMHYYAYHDLGQAALGLEHLDTAARWLEQALARSRTLSDGAMQAWCLAGLGSVAALGEEPERAARLWGAAEQLRATLGCRPPPAARATYERAIATARTHLGETAFATAWEQGCALTMEQAVAEALAVADA